jgi:hypothetical protein
LRGRVAIQLLSCVAGAIAALAAAWPVAAQTASAGVNGTGSCPLPAEVERLVSTILPAAATRLPPAVTVMDLGDAYRVGVGGRAKTYADPSRNCDQRARIAAAFIALAVTPEVAAPASTPAPDASSAAAAPAAAAPRPSPPPSPTSPVPPPLPVPSAAPVPAPQTPALAPGPVAGVPMWGRLDARAALGDAPAPGIVGEGVAIHGAFGWGGLGIGVDVRCAWMAATTLADLPSRPGGFSLERWPCGVGVTARLTRPDARLEVDVDAGLALGAVRIEGRDLFVTHASTRFEAGGRVGIDGVLHLGHGPFPIAPVVGADATYLATAYHLSVPPGPSATQTPRLWLAFTVGASWALH